MKIIQTLFVGLVTMYFTAAAPVVAQEIPGEFTYAIEMNDVVCGYGDVRLREETRDGKKVLLLEQNMMLMLTILGMEVNREIDVIYHVDPETWQYTYHEIQLRQGEQDLKSTVVIDDNVARCVSLIHDEEKVIELTPDVLLPNSLYFPFLVRDFAGNKTDSRVYRILDAQDSKIYDNKFTPAGTEKIKLAGKSYQAIILDQVIEETGIRVKLWLDETTGLMLKAVHSSGQSAYLADHSIKKKIELANLDSRILTKTNKRIIDVQNIAYMKVRASMAPTGLEIQAEDLNVPGQKFEGTIEENLITGVFEIEHPHYDGSNAPPFPTPHAQNPDMQEFLGPQALMQSDDPLLVAKAKELTAGSEDSWQAAIRLSKWVAENISYEIPGGMSARKTYDMRAGECGAHSLLLAAFCRAVDIPARVVWGCMYAPNQGGSFGQHGWTEIYMGDAGWIPVDSTAYEFDYVDSGHIRIGTYSSIATALNGKSFEILDYRIDAESATAESLTEQKYAPYIGDYQPPNSDKVFKVLVKNGQLAMDIPGQMVVPMNDPDEHGNWICKISSSLYVRFVKNDADEVESMMLHEITRIRKKSAAETTDEEIPDDALELMGVYHFAPLKLDFVILWNDGGLAIRFPKKEDISPLEANSDDAKWKYSFENYRVAFDRNHEGNISALLLDAEVKFDRKK